MEKEKIASILLVVIIVIALAGFFLITYGDEIFKNLFGKTVEDDIEFGDCIDLHYIGRYASNDTIFATSYENADSKSGGTPTKVFITNNKTESPPTEYANYKSSPIMAQTIEEFLNLSLSPVGVKEGFFEELVKIKKGDSIKKTLPELTYDKAFGRYPQIGDILNFTSLYLIPYELEIIDIKENQLMPSGIVESYGEYFGDGPTTLFVLRDNNHYIDEILETKYLSWTDSTVVTKINQTLLWMCTTPTTTVGKNFTWIDSNDTTGIKFDYPTNASQITSIDDDTIMIIHNPEINSTIEESILSAWGYYPNATYTVKNLTDNKINCSYEDYNGNTLLREFDRTITIQRNETQKITEDQAGEILEIQLAYLRHLIDDFIVGYSSLSDESVYFEIEIVNLYKTSQSYDGES
jgi:hypothetical protein